MILVLLRKLPTSVDLCPPRGKDSAIEAAEDTSKNTVSTRRYLTEQAKQLLLLAGLQAMKAAVKAGGRIPEEHSVPSVPADHEHKHPVTSVPADLSHEHPFPTLSENSAHEKVLGRIMRNDDGKPWFADCPEIHFNISHSGEWVACAFSEQEVGIDIQEHIRRTLKPLRFAHRFFTEKEYDLLLHLPEAAQPELFFRLWTIREAWLKYIGCGLRGGLNTFRPSPVPIEDLLEVQEGRPSCQSSCIAAISDPGTQECGIPALKWVPQKNGEKLLLRPLFCGTIVEAEETADLRPDGSGQNTEDPSPGLSACRIQGSGASDPSSCRIPGAGASDPSPFRIPGAEASDPSSCRFPGAGASDPSPFRIPGAGASDPSSCRIQGAPKSGMYAVIPAPEGFSMAVCAAEIPDEIELRIL